MVGWEPVLFQVLWVFKILTHLQLHYDQTVSHAWSDRGASKLLRGMSKLLRGPTTPKNLSILDNFGIFLHLFNLCSCQQGRTRNCYSGSCWAIVWTNIAWIMAAYLCRISNLHWFKCPPTCPQDDFHACMNQNKFTRAIFICEKLNNGTPIHLGIIWENLGESRTPTPTIFWGCLGSTILPRKEFELAKLQAKNQRKMANHAPGSCWKSWA